MNEGNDIKILNSTENDEALARELEKEINTNECLSTAFISNDEAIARELQGQIDREYNENLRRLEKLQNGTSKLNISYEKYRKYENYDGYAEEPSEDCDQQDNVDWDRFEAVDRTFNSIPPCGYLLTKNGDMVTKHDVSLNGQRNMKRLMSLPPNVQTGDGAASHMEISNSVLNSLKRHSQNEKHRENVRRKEKDETNLQKSHKSKKTNLQGVDQSTMNIVNSLFQGCEPYLRELYGKIGEGKESVIYHGETRKTADEFNPCQCVLKLYKLDTHDFKLQERYMLDDYRYKDRYNSKMSKRKIICLWAEKEMDNLLRLKRHNIPCPEVITLKSNVLVMSLIGDYRKPATKLKYADMDMEQYYAAYEQIVENMTNMFQNAMLIHADLSEYNILWYRGDCYFLDVSQAVEPGHDSAFEYLKRDCTNVIEFFKKKKLNNIMTRKELFKHITGQDFDDGDGIELLRTSFKNKRRSKTDDDTNRFDSLWEMSKNKSAKI